MSDEAAERAAYRLFCQWDIPRPRTKQIISEEFAPLLAAKDAEITGLTRDAAGVVEERDRLSAEVERLKAENAELRRLLVTAHDLLRHKSPKSVQLECAFTIDAAMKEPKP